MKRIIVPTDFSKTARNAIQYALDLALVFDSEILLIHGFYPATELNTGYMIDPEIETKRRAKLVALTESLVDENKGNSKAKIKITSRFIIGFPIEESVAISMNPDQLVVMGTTGSSGVIGRLFGSVSSNVVKQAGCPVLLVPQETNYRPFKNVMYASNQALLDDQVERLTSQWLAKYYIMMHVVHVNQDDKKTAADHERKIFDNLDTNHIVRKDINSDAVTYALNDYAKQESIDMLILSTRRKSFWDRLVHVSITREMSLEPTLPLLILHDSDKI